MGTGTDAFSSHDSTTGSSQHACGSVGERTGADGSRRGGIGRKRRRGSGSGRERTGATAESAAATFMVNVTFMAIAVELVRWPNTWASYYSIVLCLRSICRGPPEEKPRRSTPAHA
jgi:hypothetical protein